MRIYVVWKDLSLVCYDHNSVDFNIVMQTVSAITARSVHELTRWLLKWIKNP